MWAKRLKDKKIRINFLKKEFKSLPFLFLMNSCLVETSSRFSLSKKFLDLKKNSFKSQVKNRCVVSFRSRGIVRDFRLSRIAFRTGASGGLLLGVKKSSW